MKDYLPGGQYHNPETSVGTVLLISLSHIMTAVIMSSQSTRSTIIEFSLNNTMRWLKEQGNKHYTRAKENREDAKYVFEKRSKDIDLAHTKMKQNEKNYSKPFL